MSGPASRASSVKETDKKLFEGKAGPGRPKGVPNKTTAALKDMILQALDNKGGVEYLEKQADLNPTSFMSLVGKVLPMQLTGGDEGSAGIRIIVEGVTAGARD